MPRGIGDVTGLPALQQALAAHGYDQALLTRLCHGNWLALLDRVLPG
jgi:membrane dipeptidase